MSLHAPWRRPCRLGRQDRHRRDEHVWSSPWRTGRPPFLRLRRQGVHRRQARERFQSPGCSRPGCRTDRQGRGPGRLSLPLRAVVRFDPGRRQGDNARNARRLPPALFDDLRIIIHSSPPCITTNQAPAEPECIIDTGALPLKSKATNRVWNGSGLLRFHQSREAGNGQKAERPANHRLEEIVVQGKGAVWFQGVRPPVFLLPD